MIKNNIKNLRIELNLTQKEFAKIIYLPPSKYSYISRWETQKEQPNLEFALRIIYYLNITYNYSLQLNNLFIYIPD